jgi:phosphopantothenoylcysteine decarboxylase / phosphopantothenate---cysteine ligase
MSDLVTAPRARVLLGVSGGIAAYKAAELVRALRAAGHDVRCALTRHAASFVAPLTLEVLSGHPVHQEEYLVAGSVADTAATVAPGSGALGSLGSEAHIAVAQWANVLCLAPATAHLLARLALGMADDFLTTTALAFAGPVVAAPAMHTVMWEQAAVQQNVATLRGRGVRLVGPVDGPLASGESGMGRLADIEAIVRAVGVAAGGGPLRGRRVLVTAGPTQEPLDPVRYLGNRSSGKMGFALAAEAARRGAEVTLVAGPVALATPSGLRRVDVTTARQMEEAVRDAAASADLVIMTAAVADFRVREVASRKMKKSAGLPVSLDLVENPDILAGLRGVAPSAVLVGFAAETEDLEGNARTKLAAKGADFLVANDVSRRDIAFGSDSNEVTVYRRQGDSVFLARRPKGELAGLLLDLFAAPLLDRPLAAEVTSPSVQG